MHESRFLHMSVQEAITVIADAQMRKLGGSEPTNTGLSFIEIRRAKQTTFQSYYQPLSSQTIIVHGAPYRTGAVESLRAS